MGLVDLTEGLRSLRYGSRLCEEAARSALCFTGADVFKVMFDFDCVCGLEIEMFTFATSSFNPQRVDFFSHLRPGNQFWRETSYS